MSKKVQLHEWIAIGVATDQDSKRWAIFFDCNTDQYSVEPIIEFRK